MNRVAYILLGLILWLSCRDVATYLIFKINQDYVIENLCVYTITPEMMCKGRCFLVDELSKNREENSEGRSVLPDEKPLQWTNNVNEDLSNIDLSLFEERQPGVVTNHYEYLYIPFFLQPPIG